ncbi:MAG: methyltransferase [Lewinellaceae bacterium]|nr:methyltransferase [Lewinellaceae bacterium]
MPQPFQFKRFRVEQGGGVHPVGTDGVLLGAWAEVEHTRRVLDIGTGTGLLALMLAQRTEHLPNVAIAAVELRAEACACARGNIATSPWADRIVVVEQRVQDFVTTTGAGFDLIVSNPPFFTEDIQSPDPVRRYSRSAIALDMNDLLDAVGRLLVPSGRFCTVLPPQAGQKLMEWGCVRGLYCTRLTTVRSRPEKPVERLLIQLERRPHRFERTGLVLHPDGEGYSMEFRELTKRR